MVTSSGLGPPHSLHRLQSGEEDDLEALAAAVARRKQLRQIQKAPKQDGSLYYKGVADYDRLINVCTEKLLKDPHNIRALLIRASSYLKKGNIPRKSVLTFDNIALLP